MPSMLLRGSTCTHARVRRDSTQSLAPLCEPVRKPLAGEMHQIWNHATLSLSDTLTP